MTTLEGRLNELAPRLTQLYHRLPDTDTYPSLADIITCFSPSPSIASTIGVADKIFLSSAGGFGTHIDPIYILSEPNPFDATAMTDACIEAENGLPPARRVYPLQKMSSSNSRAIIVAGANTVPWLVVDVSAEPEITTVNGARRGRVIVYTSTAGVLSKIKKWIISMLTLARRRPDGPFQDVHWCTGDFKEICVDMPIQLGLLSGPIVCHWVIYRYLVREFPLALPDFTVTARLACAFVLEQQMRRDCGDSYALMTLLQIIQSSLFQLSMPPSERVAFAMKMTSRYRRRGGWDASMTLFLALPSAPLGPDVVSTSKVSLSLAPNRIEKPKVARTNKRWTKEQETTLGNMVAQEMSWEEITEVLRLLQTMHMHIC